ncbi:hypothetical protein [Bacillus sp. FJAT-52991]|uniref:Uncharacterized protein n=1 Tax=Bacillus kandeliae TaxID=3129297 RepID=A0ABZ2N8M4_9BACI
MIKGSVEKMNPKKARIYMWGFIALGLVSLLLTGASIPSIFGSQIGVNPFRVLKIIALISLVSAIVIYFKFLKIKKGDTI